MNHPKRLRVREYSILGGFCSLVTFHYDPGQRHLLVDFGASAGPEKKEADTCLEVARDIRETCQGELQAVAITHRHRAHVAGFAGGGGLELAACKPKIVLFPWTEDPGAPGSSAERARKAALEEYRTALAALREGVRSVLRGTSRLGQELHRDMVAELVALERDDTRVEDEMRALLQMGSTCGYLSHRRDSGLGAQLPGVAALALEPGLVDRTSTRRRVGEEVYWDGCSKHWAEVGRTLSGLPEGPFPKADVLNLDEMEAHARWFCRRIEAARGDQILRRGRLDRRLSVDGRVALELTVGGAKILLPGSAGLQSWEDDMRQSRETEVAYAVRRGEVPAGAREVGQGQLWREVEISIG